MKRILLLFPALVLAVLSCSTKENRDTISFIDEQLDRAISQYKAMEESVPDSLMPRSMDIEGQLVTSGTGWWCSGFFPGTLWYLYDYSGDEALKEAAHRRTMLIKDEQFNTGTHDLGFMLYCSFGNGLRITGNESYRPVLVNGAKSLASRYNDNVGCIRSWDHGDWEFPVIIDNMMNLEYMFWAAEETDNPSFKQLSLSHSDNTMKHHYRPDYSSWHLVDFDTLTGEVIKKKTVQGFSDESAWARGQSWGLYGFTVVYRATRDPRYLQHAEHVADFLLGHPNLPEDMVPYWDYNADDIPQAKRDASAGAIMASALLELSGYTDEERSERYFHSAKEILFSLSSEKYRARENENCNFLIKHNVGSIPHGSEIDVPLTYADYYYVEGLMRLKKMIEDD